MGPGFALAASSLTSSPGSWLSFGGLPTDSTHVRHWKCEHGFWRPPRNVAPGSSVSVGGNRTSTLPCSRDLLSIRGNLSLLCSRDYVRIPGNLLCSRDLARIPGNPSTHAALFPAFVREFLGIVYARLSVFYSQDCWRIPRNLSFPGLDVSHGRESANSW